MSDEEDLAAPPPPLPAGGPNPRQTQAAGILGGGSLGSPAKPLLEAVLVFAAFWLGAWLPSDPSMVGPSLAKPLYHLAMVFEILPKALLLLYLMYRSDGLAAFGGIAKPRAADLPKAVGTAALALLIVSVPARLISAFLPGLHNPLLSATTAPVAPPYLLVPAVLLTALSVGYAEELYFRFYLLKRLQQAGLPLVWAAIGTAVLFASGHSLQGWLGLLLALTLGGWFVLRRLRGASLHEMAWGHALYDATVMLASLYFHTRA